jgi:K+ potassium transporter
MVVLAAVATVIASQAIISGAFSLTQQAADVDRRKRTRPGSRRGANSGFNLIERSVLPV